MSIDPKFVEVAADVLSKFYKRQQQVGRLVYAPSILGIFGAKRATKLRAVVHAYDMYPIANPGPRDDEFEAHAQQEFFLKKCLKRDWYPSFVGFTLCSYQCMMSDV